MKRLIVLSILSLAACSTSQQVPGSIQCMGKSTLMALGQGFPMPLGAQGSITFDCGAGASISWGPAPK